MYLKNLSFSEAEPGLVSALNVGSRVILRNPQWNSIFVFEGMGSLFSFVLFNLKCIVDNFVS